MTDPSKTDHTTALVELARLDERLKALAREIARTEISGEKALAVSSQELHRRLEILNGEAGRLREMQSTYVLREVFDRYKEMIDNRAKALEDVLEVRLKLLEDVGSTTSGHKAATVGHQESARWLAGILVALLAVLVTVLGWLVTR